MLLRQLDLPEPTFSGGSECSPDIWTSKFLHAKAEGQVRAKAECNMWLLIGLLTCGQCSVDCKGTLQPNKFDSI